MTQLERRGVDVKVWASTNEQAGQRGRRHRPGGRAAATAAPARGSTLLAIPGVGGSGNIGARSAAATKTITDKDWDELEEEISRPADVRGRREVQRPGQARRAAARARLHGRRERRDRRQPARPASTPRPASTTSAATPARSTSTPTTARARRVADRRRSSSRRPEARLPHDLAGAGPLRPHPHRRRHLGRDRRRLRDRRRGRRARGDDARRQADRLGRRVHAVRRPRRPRRGGFYGGPPDPEVARDDLPACSTATTRSPKVRLAAFEAAIVESGVHNLNYGDRDSLGVFQQRPSAGLGHRLRSHGSRRRGGEFIRRAIRANGSARAPGSSRRTCRSRRSRSATTRSRCRPRAAGEVLRMRRLSSCCWPALSLAGCGVLDDEGPAVARKPDPAVYGPPRRCRAARRDDPRAAAADAAAPRSRGRSTAARSPSST